MDNHFEPLTLARCHFVGYSRSSTRYCRENGIDWIATQPAGGCLRLADITIEPRGRFTFADRGDPGAVEAAVVEAIADGAETVVDLVAWPANAPDKILSLLGRAAVLGEAWAASPSSYFGGVPLRLFRTPLAWLRAECRGAAVVDMKGAARWRMDLDAKVEPVGFADVLHKATLAAAGLDRIVVRKRDMAPA